MMINNNYDLSMILKLLWNPTSQLLNDIQQFCAHFRLRTKSVNIYDLITSGELIIRALIMLIVIIIIIIIIINIRNIIKIRTLKLFEKHNTSSLVLIETDVTLKYMNVVKHLYQTSASISNLSHTVLAHTYCYSIELSFIQSLSEKLCPKWISISEIFESQRGIHRSQLFVDWTYRESNGPNTIVCISMESTVFTLSQSCVLRFVFVCCLQSKQTHLIIWL